MRQPISSLGNLIIAKAAMSLFEKPLVTNIYRSVIVEAMIDEALPSSWRWCSEDYAGWDFVHEGGARLEVKQSAAKQSWKAPTKGASAPAFDIAERTGHWQDGSDWIAGPGRNAEMYVFAFHPRTDDGADHRDPEQWLFYVVPTAALPKAKTIGLPRLRTLVDPCGFGQLADSVERIRAALPEAP